jgi:DmsE family decaheme c-type cytochrome
MLATMGLGLALFATPGAGAGPPAWQECGACHEEVVARFGQNLHGRLADFEVRGSTTGCGGCHGNVAEHLASGGEAVTGLHRFGADQGGDADRCLACHSRLGQGEWHASVHGQDLGCGDCHRTHGQQDPQERCRDCHSDVWAAFHAPSHHPLTEGKMRCSSCHDVHRATEAALKTDERPNDTCLHCHTAQQGPFLFEHAPVVEDCRLCHQPHGAVANNLLSANEPFLCLQCHELHFHAGLEARDEEEVDVGGQTFPNRLGEFGYQRSFATRCTQCHTQVHGSDLPSQGISSNGRSLTR